MSEALDQEIRTLESLFWSERDPDGLAFAPLADACLRNGQVKEALDLLTDGMSRQPEYATGHVVATRLYLQQGMHSEAEFAARRVLELDPENVMALSSLASIVQERGESEEVARLRATLMEVDPEAAEAHGFADVEESGAEIDAVAAAADLETPDEPDAMDLGTLMPDADPEPAGEVEVDAMELAALVPEPEPEVEVMDLGALALESEPEVEVMELGALAPDGESEPTAEVMELGSLAPDVEVMDLGALAPEPESESEPEVEVMELGALAPEVEVMDLGALAPEPEPEPEVEVIDLGALAPDADPDPGSEVMDLGALAPDEPLDVSEFSPEAGQHDDSTPDTDEPVYTRTLAELYVKQGLIDQALNVYRQLLSVEPGASWIEERISELENDEGDGGVHPPEGLLVGEEERASPDVSEEAVETLARDLAEIGDDGHEVETPFAWADDEDSPADDGPEIGDYFDNLLGWESDSAS